MARATAATRWENPAQQLRHPAPHGRGRAEETARGTASTATMPPATQTRQQYLTLRRPAQRHPARWRLTRERAGGTPTRRV